ncbi:MAG: iron-sulfur cluster assembly scaffold protein [Pseudomonadota bacterium]
MSDPLYTTDILRLAADIPHLGLLDRADFSVTKVSPICGSRVKASVRLSGHTVAHYGQEVRACALGQASAAIVGQHVIGQRLDVFPSLLAAMQAFLKGDGPHPQGEWSQTHIFAPAQQHKARHASILLPYQALADIAVQAAQTQMAQ